MTLQVTESSPFVNLKALEERLERFNKEENVDEQPLYMADAE